MPAFDPARILRASSIRYGKLRVRGVPAILFGASAIVVAVGAMRAVVASAPHLSDTLREGAKLVEAVRKDQPRLKA
ncbi:MAG TPA: hypothetical protein VMD91_01010 [Candidatus Sulfotelmatobacter sp.]|nr:hypothetical protein [Candidatus Sulfotelmatobacter sp.]